MRMTFSSETHRERKSRSLTALALGGLVICLLPGTALAQYNNIALDGSNTENNPRVVVNRKNPGNKEVAT